MSRDRKKKSFDEMEMTIHILTQKNIELEKENDRLKQSQNQQRCGNCGSAFVSVNNNDSNSNHSLLTNNINNNSNNGGRVVVFALLLSFGLLFTASSQFSSNYSNNNNVINNDMKYDGKEYEYDYSAYDNNEQQTYHAGARVLFSTQATTPVDKIPGLNVDFISKSSHSSKSSSSSSLMNNVCNLSWSPENGVVFLTTKPNKTTVTTELVDDAIVQVVGSNNDEEIYYNNNDENWTQYEFEFHLDKAIVSKHDVVAAVGENSEIKHHGAFENGKENENVIEEKILTAKQTFYYHEQKK